MHETCTSREREFDCLYTGPQAPGPLTLLLLFPGIYDIDPGLCCDHKDQAPGLKKLKVEILLLKSLHSIYERDGVNI